MVWFPSISTTHFVFRSFSAFREKKNILNQIQRGVFESMGNSGGHHFIFGKIPILLSWGLDRFTTITYFYLNHANEASLRVFQVIALIKNKNLRPPSKVFSRFSLRYPVFSSTHLLWPTTIFAKEKRLHSMLLLSLFYLVQLYLNFSAYAHVNEWHQPKHMG